MTIGIKSAVYGYWPNLERSLYPSLNMCKWEQLHEFIDVGDATRQELSDAVEDEVYPEWSATAVWVNAGLEVRSYNGRCTVLLRKNGTAKIYFSTPSITHLDWVMYYSPAIIQTTPLLEVEYPLEFVNSEFEGTSFKWYEHIQRYARRWYASQPNVFHTFEPELLPASDKQTRVSVSKLTQDEYWKDTTYVSLGGRNDKEQ
jgi:hypothetical protein